MRVSRRFCWGVAAVVAASILSGWGTSDPRALAQEEAQAADQEEDPGVPVFPDEPEAHALYDQMVRTMRQADSLSYVSHYSWEAKGRVLGDCTYRAWLKKPNQFRVETESATRGEGGTLVGDGKYLWIFWPQGRPRFYAPDDENYEKNEATRQTSYMKKRTRQGAVDFLAENGATFPTILDPSDAAQKVCFQDYRTSGVPANYIIDREGKVVDAWYGYEKGHRRARAAFKKASLELEHSPLDVEETLLDVLRGAMENPPQEAAKE